MNTKLANVADEYEYELNYAIMQQATEQPSDQTSNGNFLILTQATATC